MFGSATLDVGIGLIFVFILVSIICTAIREGVEAFLKTRASYLEHGIRQLLNDPDSTGIVKSFYNHPQIFGLFNKEYTPSQEKEKPGVFARGKNLPSYIPAKNFAMAMMDIAARGTAENIGNTSATSPVISLESIRQNIDSIGNAYVQRILLTAVDNAQGSLTKLQTHLEDWYNSGMDRVSGWYKRSSQTIIFLIGLVIAVGLNINCLKIANYLSNNEAARNVIVERASVLSKDSTFSGGNYDSAKKELYSLSLPIGWDSPQSIKLDESKKGFAIWNSVIGPALGWLIIAFASTLGAPFWFDMLNKVMVIRSTVKPHQKSGEEASTDRQDTKPQVMVVAPPVAQTPPDGVATPAPAPATPPPAHDELDGCDVQATEFTSDEDLPETKGGTE